MTKRIIIAAAFIACFVPMVLADGELVATHEDQSSYARAIGAVVDGQKGIAVIFEGTDDLHYYADEQSAPGKYNLKIELSADGAEFGNPTFPASSDFYDIFKEENVAVYVGNFTVFFPMDKSAKNKKVDISITGLACTSELCLSPFEVALPQLDLAKTDWPVIKLGGGHAEKPATQAAAKSYSWPIAFVLAVIAGFILNIMPCVWPVIPIIVMRIWQQSQESKAKSIVLGAAFSSGILLFFAAIAILNIVLRLGFDTVYQWGDQLRNPEFVIALTMVMVVLSLFMFDLFSFGIPASVSAKAGNGSGALGLIGMGFMAALLSTPCSFALLATVFAWAQTQPLTIATIAIMLMGVGMAAPYMILTAIPGLVNKMPKPGGWMGKVKIGLGFLLLLIAVKMFEAVPAEMKINVLYYAVLLSICTWIFGWVNYVTPKGKKWTTRIVAIGLAIVAGTWLLPVEKNLIDWGKYDAVAIDKHIEDGKPVLIKFTADWCMTCKVVDKFVFKKKDVAELLKQKGVVTIKADTTTTEMPATIALENKYKEPGVPVTILHLPDGSEEHLVGMIDKDDLLKIIEKLPDVENE